MLIEPNRFAFFSFTHEQEEPSYKCIKTKIRCKMPDTYDLTRNIYPYRDKDITMNRQTAEQFT